MQVDQLRYLLAVVRTGSFTEAAKELSITPQGVSQSISRLEQGLGSSLFYRKDTQLIPTEFTRSILSRAEAAVLAFDQLEAHIAQLTQEDAAQVFRLGVVATPYRGIIFTKRDFRLFYRKPTKPHLELNFLSNEYCVSCMKAGLFDAAIVQGAIEHPRVECAFGGFLRPLLAMADSHPLAKKHFLHLQDLDNRRIAFPLDSRCVLQELVALSKAARINLNLEEISPTKEGLVSFLQAGGIALVRRNNSIVNYAAGLTTRPFFPGEKLVIPLFLAYKSSLKEQMKPLVAHLKTFMRRHPDRF